MARGMAHAGTLVEFTFPVLLLLGDGGTLTTVGLITMVVFHIFVTSNIPMGVPIEWNFIMVYGAFALFGTYAQVEILAMQTPQLIGFLAIAVVLVPVVGNLFPRLVSFLVSMRYYAGNWAYSIWLFKGNSSEKLDQGLTKSAPRVNDQLRKFYDEDTITAIFSKVMAFRALHLQGRSPQILLPKTVDRIDDYEYLDGELVAGIVIGYNFGDGHLHNMQLLEAVQQQCAFEEGELRCVFVESQPFFGKSLAYTIANAAKGVLEQGEVEVKNLLELQPWPAEAG